MNPYNYEGHLERITALSGPEHVEQRVKVRQEMAAVFAVLPQQALDWITDIDMLPVGDAAKRQQVEQVLSQACQDYRSVDIWIKYDEFLQEQGESADRSDLFNYDITACHRFHKHMYRTSKDKSRFFMDLLSLPHLNHADSFEMYKEWKHSEITDPAEYDKAVWWMKKDGGYDKAVMQLERFQKFEDMLVHNQHSWESYQFYIAQIPKLVVDKRQYNDYTVALYERAILNGNMLNESVWKSYIEFAKSLYDGVKILDLSSRAVRNVTWSLDLWLIHLRLQQREHGKDLSQINMDLPLLAMDAYMRASIDTCVVLLMEVSAIRIRQQFQTLGPKASLKKKAELFHDVYQTTVFDKLSEYHPNSCDPFARLERRYAKMLVHINPKESAEAVGTFDQIFDKNIRRKYSELWLDYMNFLHGTHSDIAKIRNAFIQALDAKNIHSLDWPEVLIEKWKEFEDIYGTIETSNEAWETIDTLLPKIIKRRQNEATRVATQPTREPIVPVVSYEPQKDKSEKKRQAGSDDNTSQSVVTDDDEHAKKTRTIGPARLKDSDPEKASLTVFVSNLPKDMTEGKLQYMFRACGPTADIRIICDDKNARTFAYVEFPNSEAAAKALSLDKTPIDGTKRLMFVSEFKPKARPDAGTNSLFISNLPDNMDEVLLRTVFEPCGTVSSIRIPGKKFQNRACAFVQFEDGESAKLALSLNDLEIGDETRGTFKIKVERSKKPPPPERDSAKMITVPANLVPVQALGSKRGPSTARIGTALNFQQQNTMQVDDKPKSNQDFRSLLRK